MQDDKRILLVAQKTADTDEPREEDLYRVGTLASILQMLKLPDGTVKVLVEGVHRARIASFDFDGAYLTADCQQLPDDKLGTTDDKEIDAATRRSEEHTSELQSLMRISYAVFCLKKKKTTYSK